MIEEEAEKVPTENEETTATETKETEANEPETAVGQKEKDEREPKFIIDTNLTLELHFKANMVMGGKGRAILFVMSIILIAIGAIKAIIDAVVYGNGVDATSVILIAFGIFVLLFACFFQKLVRKGLEKKLQGRNIVSRHVWYIDGFESRTYVTAAAVTITHDTKGNFAAFTEIRECRDFWILYYGKNGIDIMEKKGMKQGEAAELSRFLAVRLGAKYKVCNK